MHLYAISPSLWQKLPTLPFILAQNEFSQKWRNRKIYGMTDHASSVSSSSPNQPPQRLASPSPSHQGTPEIRMGSSLPTSSVICCNKFILSNDGVIYIIFFIVVFIGIKLSRQSACRRRNLSKFNSKFIKIFCFNFVFKLAAFSVTLQYQQSSQSKF